MSQFAEESLFDRLTAPTSGQGEYTRGDPSAGNTRAGSSANLGLLTASLIANIQSVLNTRRSLPFPDDQERSRRQYPELYRSVYCFGVDELEGPAGGSKGEERLRAAVKEAVSTFEPRIIVDAVTVELPDQPDFPTIQLSANREPKLRPYELRLRISGRLRTLPTPASVVLRTTLEIDPLNYHVELAE
jgi:predicted component of type VI protein secretion system